MRRASRRQIRPVLEGLEARQLLSTAAHWQIISQPIPLTGTESGT